MIRGGYYYPDKIWKNKPHIIESSGEFAGDCAYSMIVGNRRGGKTGGVGIFAIADYLIYGYRSVLIRRYDKDFTSAKAPAMPNFWGKSWNYRSEFIDVVKSDIILQKIYPLDLINSINFEDHELTFKEDHALIDNRIFCYPVMLNKFDKNKNNNYENVHNILYDEFIPETGTSGLKNEFMAVANVFDTIARGRKDALKTTGIVLMANTITGVNEFYTAFHIDKELRLDTKILSRPEKGWMLEVVHNKIAEAEVVNSPFGRALSCCEQGREYLGYSQGNQTFDDNDFVETITGEMIYVLNIKFGGKIYAIKILKETGIYYFTDDGVDPTYRKSYAVTREDHGTGTVLIRGRQRDALNFYKSIFDQGLMRFNALRTKKIFLDLYPYL